MSLRNLQLLDFPNPKYDKYGLDRFVTIILYHGGEVKHSPIAEFVRGNQSKFDYVDVEDMCIPYLNGLGEKLGYMGPKRPVIGVDGCPLKGPHSGILLTAVSIDPNNILYPLAYAVVSGETRESWEWFLELLEGDLNVVRDDTYTFISDKQKGLIPAFESVFPGATNRFGVRHLHNNTKTTGFRGLAFKKTLWNAARATTLHEFNLRMEEMGHRDPKAIDWLSDKPPEHWSRSHFNCFPKCDMLLNNICETFNSCILEAREKPILTMLEWIREFIMTRLSDNRDRAIKK
ncbi:hypothetical protein Sango_0816600 [Sesamum angolense]|uniref:MULE transposase domain-containing protein n=1 Tax=Sesamum angolense TaxID=2727404 RepID=A0AAE2C0R8_9LAMI|nr:hypothetical protein Sango_0816600 [Sesamum angolense]